MFNNQGLDKGYQPQPAASFDNPYLYLDYSGYHNNCLSLYVFFFIIIVFVGDITRALIG